MRQWVCFDQMERLKTFPFSNRTGATRALKTVRAVTLRHKVQGKQWRQQIKFK
jgi:hypothetical protein